MKLVHTREGSTCIQALWWEKVLDLLAATWEATWLTWPSGVSICLDFCCLFIFQKFLGCITLVTKTDQGQGRLLNVLIEYHVVFFWCVMSWTIIYCWLLYDIFIVTVFACVDIYPLLCGIFCCCCYYNVLLLHKRSHLERGTNRGKGGESRD